MIKRGRNRLDEGNAKSDIIHKSAFEDPDDELGTSRVFLFDKLQFLFCHEEMKESPNCVETANMGKQFLEIGKETNTTEIIKKRRSLLVADGNPLSAVAYDM